MSIILILILGYCSEGADRDRSLSGDSAGLRFRGSRRIVQQQSTTDDGLSWIPEGTGPIIVHESHAIPQAELVHENVPNKQEEGYLAIPKTIAASNSADTLTGKYFL